MKNLLLTTAITFALGMPAFAGGSHSDSHDEVKTEESHGHGNDGHAMDGHGNDGHGNDDDGHGDGGHAGGGHGDEHGNMAVGMPGMAGDVTRTIDVVMLETDDGDMIFKPGSFEIKEDETIRFNIKNNGELQHEFVIDTVAGNEKHKGEMEEMEEMHDDPNSVLLDAGESAEIIWKFTKVGTFEFACLIPGHYESGMFGPIRVSR